MRSHYWSTARCVCTPELTTTHSSACHRVITWNPNGFISIPRALTICSVIRRYEFTISRKTIAPDGYQKKSLLINGQFPGPLIEANW